MFKNLTALVLWIFLAATSSADLILVTFTKDAAPEFGTPGVLASGHLDVVANMFTIINFSTTDSAVYAIPSVPIIMNAWEILDETTLAPWDIDDASQETEIRIALDSGTFGFLADKSNSQINWNTAPGLGRIGWGISYDEPSGTFGGSGHLAWYGWHDSNNPNSQIRWNDIPYSLVTAVPEPSSALLVATAAVLMLFYRRRRS